MTFRFRLQTLLRLRFAERDQRRADLAKALRAEEMLHAEIATLEVSQRQAADRTRTLKSPGAANIDALVQSHRYEVVLATQRRQLAVQLQQVAAETERRRQALVEADRGVRVLEKLSERQAMAWRKAEERREGKELDEIATLGFVRRQEALP